MHARISSRFRGVLLGSPLFEKRINHIPPFSWWVAKAQISLLIWAFTVYICPKPHSALHYQHLHSTGPFNVKKYISFIFFFLCLLKIDVELFMINTWKTYTIKKSKLSCNNPYDMIYRLLDSVYGCRWHISETRAKEKENVSDQSTESTDLAIAWNIIGL